MSSWAFDQASSACRRVTMFSEHFSHRPHVPESGRHESVQHGQPSHPLVAHSGMIATAQHQTLPSINHLIDIADYHYPPAALIEFEEDVQSPEMTSPSPTPSSPMDLSAIVGGMNRSSESPLIAPVSQTRKTKRQKLSEMAPEEIKARQELDAEVGEFLDDKAKASANKAKKLPMPQKKVFHHGSNSKTRHNISQTILRGQKGSKRLTMQRVLCSRKWRSPRLQTKKNALSSGQIYEEKATLEGSIQTMVMNNLFRDIYFKDKHQDEITAMLPEFQPDMIRPEDDSQAAKFKVMKEADQPFRWQDMRDEGEIRRVLETFRSFANAPGQKGIDDYLNNMSKSPVARL